MGKYGGDWGLELAFSERPDAHRICWKGRANDPRPTALLAPLFEDLLHLAQKKIEFDMSGLEHISSSTLVLIMQFLKKAHEQGLVAEVKYDSTVRWQRMTFAPLRNMMTRPCPAEGTGAYVPAA